MIFKNKFMKINFKFFNFFKKRKKEVFVIPKNFIYSVFLFVFCFYFTACENKTFSDLSESSFFESQYTSANNENSKANKNHEEEPELRFSFQMMDSSPTAVLPDDKIVKVGALVSIDGAMSEGAESYRWSFDVFPTDSNSIINDSSSRSISFTPDVPGLYLVKLVVRDMSANSKASYLAVRAEEDNSPPSFNFGLIGSWNNGFPQAVRIRLENIDDDNEISLIEVDYGDGHQTVFYDREVESLDDVIEHYYLKEGSYEITVSMIDNQGGKTTKSTTINLRKDSKIPHLKYSVNSVSGVAPFTLRVDASASFDPDNNNPLHFYWDWGDDEATYTKDTVSTHTYTEPGIYTVYPFTADRGAGERYNSFTVYVDDPDDPGAYSAPNGGSPPVLNLANTTSSYAGKAPLTVHFDASESFDLEGDSFEAFWGFEGFSFKKFEEGLKVSKTYDNPGYYPFHVTLRDSHGNEFIHSSAVFVYDPLVKEQSRFFARQTSSDPYEVRFLATTQQLYGVPAQYFFWELGNGHFEQGIFNYTYPESGVYPVTFSTVDIFGNRQSVSKTLTIDGKKHAISSRVKPFYEAVQVNSFISFSGEESSSSAPGMLDFFWYLVTGVREAISFNYSYSKRGAYSNQMFATNSYGFSDIGYHWISVNSGEGPTASAKFSTYIGTAPLTVNFDASRSKSPGTITDYDWHIADYEDADKSFTGSNVSHTYKSAGERYPNLYIKDSNGNFDAKFYQVTVLDPNDVDSNNQSPSIRINANAIEISDLEVDMASDFSDSDGHIRYTEWDWGDGLIDVFRYSESSPFHRYKSYGSYQITVRVFDNMGAIAQATHNITLTQPTPQNSAQSAPSSARGQTQIQRVFVPEIQFSQDRFNEERKKDGCYRKANGQIRCYSSGRKKGGR